LRGRRNGRRQRRGRRAGLGWSADLRSAVLSAASGQLGTEEHRSAHCDGAEQAPYFQTPTALPSPRCWILGTARVQTLGVRKVLPRLTHMLIVVFFAPRCLPAIPKCALELKVMDCGKLTFCARIHTRSENLLYEVALSPCVFDQLSEGSLIGVARRPASHWGGRWGRIR